ncbi:MAG: beta-glucosidase BglX [Porphyromonadaceae bacterium]|nr:MAG: beta-glucosidase BglX [Porphyromonadaceae bacterium]
MKKIIFLAAMSILGITACKTVVKETPDNSEKEVMKKADSVLALMTLDEKIGQLNQFSGDGELTGPVALRPDLLQSIRDGKVGSMLNINGADYTRKIQKIAIEESRLKIPLIFGYDVIHGYKTIFPIPLGEAASWDIEVAERSARIGATEAAAAGQHWTFAPMVDIARDPRWGRIMEGSGEDPYLGSRLAEARVKGFQGKNLADITTILACAKHYAGYGNAQAGRDYYTTDMSDNTLREIYLPPFKAAAKAGVETFMSAFNDLNGVPATGNKYLIHDILKTEWAFKGMVVSDWGSISEMIPHGIVANKYEAGDLAFNAGVDMDMEGNVYLTEMKNLLKDGNITEAQIDESVRRVLRLKFLLGLFEDPYRYSNTERESQTLLKPEFLAEARDAARKSFVLLKNENQVLPLNISVKSVALIGPAADAADDMIGNWSGRGEGKHVITLKKELETRLGAGKVLYAKGANFNDSDKSGFAAAMAAARRADIIIAACGEAGMMSGESMSRADISIPGVQEELILEMAKLGKPMVLVLFNGRPLILTKVNTFVPAILEAWIPGTMTGPALCDVLFGEYNPSGKLPVTFPYSVGQIPIYYNHKNSGRPGSQEQKFTSRYLDVPNDPLFPFGYGLSYTQFAYNNLILSESIVSDIHPLEVRVDIKNTGLVAGTETVQLYIRDLVGSVTRPVKELKGFTKVMLKAGEVQTVSFKVAKEDLSFYNREGVWGTEPGKFKVFVGTNSQNTIEAGFELK